MMIVLKKIVLPVFIFGIILSLFLSAGCSFMQSKTTTEPSTVLQSDTTQTSLVMTEVTQTPSDETPAVVTYYELNKTNPVDADFTAGFVVKLPKIVSEKPGAQDINAGIDEIKTKIEQAYNAIPSFNDFTEQHKYSYDYIVKNNILFLSINGSIGYWQSEFVVGNLYYAYDYILDKTITDNEIAQLFSLDESQIVDMVNTELTNRGVMTITGFDKIKLFVNAAGKLVADVSVESEMGGEYSEMVELT